MEKLGLKNRITEIKKEKEMEGTEERISNLKDRAIEIVPSE